MNAQLSFFEPSAHVAGVELLVESGWPDADVADLVARLLAYLTADTGWRTRADIRVAIGLTDRECRLARQHSDGRIVYGQKGFRATRHATLEEIAACANTLESQGKTMLSESIALRRLAHGRVG